MKYIILLLICSACQQAPDTEAYNWDDPKNFVGPDSTAVIKNRWNWDTADKYIKGDHTIFAEDQNAVIIRSLGAYYCCDTVRTLNDTAIVKSVFDSTGTLIDFEIVKVLN